VNPPDPVPAQDAQHAPHPAVYAPHIVPKPWGREVWFGNEPEYAGKILEVSQGHALSLQKHVEKKETMYLWSGRVRVHLNGDEFILDAGAALTINPGDVHRVEALEDTVILEVSTPHLDDLVRLEDRYGR
jgi:quercetin dioxygenase-like cupin family protein